MKYDTLHTNEIVNSIQLKSITTYLIQFKLLMSNTEPIID